MDLIQVWCMQNGNPSILPPANEVWGKVIFSEACVKNSVHRGRGCLSACWDTTPLGADPPGTRHPPRSRHPPTRHPPTRHPPGPDTPPWEQAPPGSRSPRTRHPSPQQSMLRDTVNERAVCILLNCNLVFDKFRKTYWVGLYPPY